MALMSSLTDPFTADPDAAVWTVSGDASVGSDGHLHLYNSSLRSVATYEFDSASVRIQSVDPYTGTFDLSVVQDETTENPWPDNRAMWMSVTHSTGLMHLWWQGYGASWAAAEPPTMSWPDYGGYFEVAYDPATMAYLRMTNTVVGTQLVATYLASADGLTWSTLYQFTADPDTTYPYRASMGVLSGWAQLHNFNLADTAAGSTIGDGTFGSGTFGDPVPTPPAAPDGLTLTLTLDAPVVDAGVDAHPDGLALTLETDPPAATEGAVVGPDALAVPLALGAPAVGQHELPEQPSLFDYTDVPKFATQILGIGPWSPIVLFRGAVNYGIGKGRRPAQPIMSLPYATALSYTLRLTGGNEATASFALPRGAAIVIEEMHTDLWWRRKDPYTGAVESIGRFNASTNDLTSDGSIVTSSVHWVDYETLLGERMVLKYLTTVRDDEGNITIQQSQWPKGTPVTQIMRFAVPTNTGVELTALDSDTLLGVTTQPFTLPPESTIAELFTNLLAISAKPWEWWIEQNVDVSRAPKLTFVVGKRGQQGVDVVLFDLGTGPSPIASWTMTAATTQYANALYYTGSVGGVIYTIAAQIAEFGQRDAKDGNSNLVQLKSLQAAAQKKLAEVADRRPTFSVKLRTGFWRGRAHIDLGDRVRLVLRMGEEVLDYTYRVSEIAVEVDETNAENVTLTLGTPRASADPRSRQSAVMRLIAKLRNYKVPDNSDPATGTVIGS